MTCDELLNLLASFGIVNVKLSANNIMMSCPNPNHEDKNPSFGISINKKGHPCCCFVCQEGMNVVTLVQRLFEWKYGQQITYEQALKYVKRFGDPEITGQKSIKFSTIQCPGDVISYKSKGWEYLQSRGFKSIPNAPILYTNESLIFPLILPKTQRIVGYSERFFNPVDKRYITHGIPIPYLLHQAQKYGIIVLTEGSIDALKLLYYRHHENWCPIALLSTSNAFLHMLPKDSRIVICLDADADKQTENLLDKLLSLGYSVKAYQYSSPQDPGEFTEEDVRKLEEWMMSEGLFGKKADEIVDPNASVPVEEVQNDDAGAEDEELLRQIHRGAGIDTLVQSRSSLYLRYEHLPNPQSPNIIVIPQGFTSEVIAAANVHRVRLGKNFVQVLCKAERCEICHAIAQKHSEGIDAALLNAISPKLLFLIPLCLYTPNAADQFPVRLLTSQSVDMYNTIKILATRAINQPSFGALIWNPPARIKTIQIWDQPVPFNVMEINSKQILTLMQHCVGQGINNLVQFTKRSYDDVVNYVKSLTPSSQPQRVPNNQNTTTIINPAQQTAQNQVPDSGGHRNQNPIF